MTVHVRLVALAAALLGGLLTLPASAAEGQLRIEATRSAIASFEVEEARIDVSRVAVSGGGRNVVVSIWPASAGEKGAGFAVLRLADFGGKVSSHGFPRLAAGRYEVRVSSDRPVRVILPLLDQGVGQTVRATRTISSNYTLVDRRLGAGTTSEQIVRSGAVGSGRWAVVAYAVTGRRLEQTYGCLTEQASCPGLPLALPAPAVDPAVHEPSASNGPWVRLYPPTTGPRDALFGVQGARVDAGSLRAAVLTF